MSFAEEIASNLEDDMSDAFYTRLHTPLEVVERLHDHNRTLVEVTMYDIFDQISEEVAMED